MKLLLLSDLHSSYEALVGIDKLLAGERFDLVLCAGDICDRHDRGALSFAGDFIDLVTKKHRQMLRVIYGNNDPEQAIALYRNRGVLLHGKRETIGNKDFAGIGDLETHPLQPNEKLPDVSGTILITHRPPSKQQFKVSGLRFKRNPKIHIAGHLHQRAETWQLGDTLVIQLPAAIDGRYAVLTLPDKVEFKWFKNSAA